MVRALDIPLFSTAVRLKFGAPASTSKMGHGAARMREMSRFMGSTTRQYAAALPDYRTHALTLGS
jgi:hypothetical protein